MNDNWLTPPIEIERFKKVAGGAITTDPFWHPKSFSNPTRAFSISNSQVNNRNVFFNGLCPDLWIGDRIWVNCPYSKPLPCMQAVVSYHHKNPKAIIGVLLNSTTETKAFSLVRRYTTYRVEYLHRVGFIDPNTMRPVTGNQYSQTLLLLGPVEKSKVIATYTRCDISRGPIHVCE